MCARLHGVLQSCEGAKIAFCLAALEGKKINLLVDSMGLKIFGEDEWKMRTHGKRRRIWRKSRLGVDEEMQQIAVVDLTLNNVGDQEHLPEILDGVSDGINLGRVTADGIYDTWGCYDAATLVRKNVVEPTDKTGLKDHSRAQAIQECEKRGRDESKKSIGYHQRSLAETAMYCYKISFGERIFSRKFKRQKMEVRIKVKTLNTFHTFAAPHYELANAAWKITQQTSLKGLFNKTLLMRKSASSSCFDATYLSQHSATVLPPTPFTPR